MSEQEYLIEEYKSLRAEIEQNSRFVSTLFIANTGVTATLVGIGLDKQNPYFFLAPMAIIIPSLYYISSKLLSTTRIGSYIRVFLEPKLDLSCALFQRHMDKWR